MEFIRLYTVLLTHPKQVRTPPAAWKVLTLAWMYAGQHETGGRVPPEARQIIGMTASVEAKLVELGWMHRNGSGWVLHDWEDHQAAVDEASEMRRKARERKAAERKRRREAEGHGSA